MNLVSKTSTTAHMNVVTRKYIIMIRNKYIYNFWRTVFYFALSLHSSITCENVSSDYMPGILVTWEEQRNNFIFHKEKEKYV